MSFLFAGELLRKTTVREKGRFIFTSTPVEPDAVHLDALAPARSAARVFGTKSASLVIGGGEGGAGKTSLACQLMNWAMAEDEKSRLAEDGHLILPILIESDFNPVSNGSGRQR